MGRDGSTWCGTRCHTTCLACFYSLSDLRVLPSTSHPSAYLAWALTWPVAPSRVPAGAPTDKHSVEVKDEEEGEEEEPHFDADVSLYSVQRLSAHGATIYDLARPDQSCKKITIFDLKDRDLFIDLDQFMDLLKLILIFDLQNCRSFCNHF